MASDSSERIVAALMGAEQSAPLVLSLAEIGEVHRAVVGGKAANLAALWRAGAPVPPGFCVTTAAFDQFLACRKIQSCPEPALVPAQVREAVLAAWRSCGMEVSYAVRSSATVEDAPEKSFAGQFESVLQVRGAEALLAAIQSCWLSLFSERALAYLSRQRVPMEKVKMAVLVQEMVAAEYSGVAFTADPLSGRTDRVVVEWVPGLGETLVQGTQEPNRVVIEKETRRVLAWDKTRGLLPEVVWRRLLELADQAERLFRAPQDIEWAQQDGKVWLLQARPITTQGRGAEVRVEVWSNMNAVENLPEVVTPLMWSLLEHILIRYLAPVMKLAGVDPRTEAWLGLVAGRVYFNVGSALKLARCLPGFRADRLGWLFGGHQDELTERLGLQTGAADIPLRERMAALLRIMRLAAACLLQARWRSGRACLAWMGAWVDRFERINCLQITAEDLFARLNAVEDDLQRRSPLPVTLGTGLICHGLFRRGCRNWFHDSHDSLANRLLSRAGGMASAEPAMAMWQMAQRASEQGAVRDALKTARNYGELADRLSPTAAGQEFLGQWDQFMRRHGHHTSGEVDIMVPRWSETPDEVLRLVQGYLDRAKQCNPSQLLEERTRERERVLKECRARLRNPLKRWWFGFLLRQTQQWVVLRENVKSEAIRGMAAFRRIFLELGARMCRQGILECKEDIFFLTVEEYEPAFRGTAAINVKAVVAARRAEFERNRAVSPPTLVVGRFDPSQPARAPDYQPDGELRGLPVSAGIVTGRARVLLRADSDERLLPGEVLVAPFTNPGWTPYFLTAVGLVTDIGGQLSHGSVVAREYGLPAVVNVPSATKIIQTGDLVRVDGDTGRVSILECVRSRGAEGRM
jgi:rifampicin phosphotransferase